MTFVLFSFFFRIALLFAQRDPSVCSYNAVVVRLNLQKKLVDRIGSSLPDASNLYSEEKRGEGGLAT